MNITAPTPIAACAECGGSHIEVRAFAVWNCIERAWELERIDEDADPFCVDCDAETRVTYTTTGDTA